MKYSRSCLEQSSGHPAQSCPFGCHLSIADGGSGMEGQLPVMPVTNLAWGEVSVRLSLPRGLDSRKTSKTGHCCKPPFTIFKGAPFSDVFAAQAPQPGPFGATFCLDDTWQGAFHPGLWLQVLQQCRW